MQVCFLINCSSFKPDTENVGSVPEIKIDWIGFNNANFDVISNECANFDAVYCVQIEDKILKSV